MQHSANPKPLMILAGLALFGNVTTSSWAFSAHQPERIVTGIADGMTITTADVVGSIDVRAMSYGPGFCTTEITVGHKTVSLAAPPATHTEWVEVMTHTGSVGFTVSQKDICDTGAQVQIRYWRGD